MGFRVFVLFFVASGFAFLGSVAADEGHSDPLYVDCFEKCRTTGLLKDGSVSHCQVISGDLPTDDHWYKQEPLYVRWKAWNCKSECQHHCMIQRENEREALGLPPVKYHGKWTFKRVFVFHEPLSAAFSALTLLVQFNGWLSFFVLLNYKVPPVRPQGHKTYYEFSGLWHIYGVLSINSWFWSAIYHSRDCEWTEKFYYSSSVALLGFSLILAILRTFNVKVEASRVMVAAPLLAFFTTHILYLNFYRLDLGLNMKVSTSVVIVQLLLWAVWSFVVSHPSRFKLLIIAAGGITAKVLEVYDFPPYEGYVDAHAVGTFLSIPLSFLWWSFVKEDAQMRIAAAVKKTK